MHEDWEIRNLPIEEKSLKNLKNHKGRGLEWERECLGDEQVRTDWERSKKWESDREEWIYRPLVKLDRCRCREVLRKLSRSVSRKWSSTAEVSRNNSSDPRTEARSINQVSRSYWGGRSFLDRSTRYPEAVGKAIRNSWRISTDSKVSMRYWGGVESLFKTSFSRVKNTDINAIQHATQPMIQSTQ